MHYIVMDLEFNQDFASLQHFETTSKRYPFEIIQIAALKLDASFHTIGTFNRYVKPFFYGQICPFITSLTGITLDQLIGESSFPDVYQAFTAFIGGADAIFCTWGMSDMKELHKNISYHNLSNEQLPRHYINIQPVVSKYLNLPTKKLLRLEHATNALHLPTEHAFHDALNDAYYTSEIFKTVYDPSIKPSYYDPTYRPSRPLQRKRQVDTPALLDQFAKMYERPLTKEEEKMIVLAYQMGKTGQFIK